MTSERALERSKALPFRISVTVYNERNREYDFSSIQAEDLQSIPL